MGRGGIITGMGLPKPKQLFTLEEYLRREYDSLEKHEYYRGEMIAMSGGTFRHSMIISNAIRELGNALKGKPCRVLDSNMRVRVARDTLYAYPDASVVCGEPQFDPADGRQTTITQSHTGSGSVVSFHRALRPRHEVRELPPDPITA